MRISGIIHQQICQLKWHLLACLGLIMALPVMDVLNNYRGGQGFNSTEMMTFSLIFSPLLAGLIACANVQADLNEKRYIFWRSKPAGVKRLIALKFVIGLIAALTVLAACPLAFSFLTATLSGQDFTDVLDDADVNYLGLAPIFLLIAIMAYSLCFASNVIVRKTARSWLIGMLLVCFIVVIPIMLPLDVKDFVADVVFGMPAFYPALMLAASAIAFAFALLAAQHDWHLKTSLKGMLWAGAALVFAAMILLTSQVANIKVLDEKHVGDSWRHLKLNHIGNQIVHDSRNYVNIDNNRISFSEIEFGEPNTHQPLPVPARPELKDYRLGMYPDLGNYLYHKTDDGIYTHKIHTYYHVELIKRLHTKPYEKREYKRIFLKIRRLIGKSSRPVGELDISDCITDRKDHVRIAMRPIDNLIVVRVNRSLVVVDATNPARLKRIETKIDALERPRWIRREHQNEFAIPLIPLESIDVLERVKFSIDFRYSGYSRMHEFSMVDIQDGKIGFVCVSDDDIVRYHVTHWDDEKVYCSLVETRPFTILEIMTNTSYAWRTALVENGRLYLYRNDTLMVFDIRSNRRIRKLGHFVRMNHMIEDLAVFGDGKILLSVINHREKTEDDDPKEYLYLLENPG